MSRSFLRHAAFAAGLSAALLASDGASAAPPGLPDTAVTLDLKQASVANVFRMLADFANRKIALDPCVKGGVDLQLQNTPLPLVFDALAMKLGLVYDDEGGTIRVGCRGDVPASRESATAPRVTLLERDAELPDILQHLAVSAKLDGVDYRATAKPKVNVTLESVRLATAVRALAESANVDIEVAKNRLVVRDALRDAP